MLGCGTVVPPCTQYLYSDFYCLKYQQCWKDRTAWKRSCSPPGARSVKVEDQSRTHDTIAPRNNLSLLGKSSLQATQQDQDHGNLKGFCCLLRLAHIPTLSYCRSQTAHRFKGYHRAGRSSARIWSVHLVTVYRPLNTISWSTAQKDPSHVFFMSHTASVVQGVLPLWQSQQRLGLVSQHHVAPLLRAELCLRHVVSSCSGEKRRWKGWGEGGCMQSSNRCLSEGWLFRVAKLAPVHHG